MHNTLRSLSLYPLPPSNPPPPPPPPLRLLPRSPLLTPRHARARALAPPPTPPPRRRCRRPFSIFSRLLLDRHVTRYLIKGYSIIFFYRTRRPPVVVLVEGATDFAEDARDIEREKQSLRRERESRGKRDRTHHAASSPLRPRIDPPLSPFFFRRGIICKVGSTGRRPGR